MSESPDQIRKHIKSLSEFERKYGEYLHAVRREWNGEGKAWPDPEKAERKRKIQMLAVRADRAMKASGVGQIMITHSPVMGGGIKSTDLPSQVFDFDDFAFGSDDGMEIQWQILARIPSQIAGLEIQLEEAEAREQTRAEPSPRTRPNQKRRLPTLIGRIRHVPPFIGFIADIGGFVVVIGAIGHFAGFW